MYPPSWGHHVRILCYREKEATDKRCQIGCKSQRKETTDLDQKAAGKYFLFHLTTKATFTVCRKWKLTSYHVTGVLKRQTPAHLVTVTCYLQLFDTGLCENDCTPLAVATNHVNQTARTHTCTHQASTHQPRWINFQNWNTFAIVQSIKPINMILLQTRGRYTDTRISSICLEK